VTDASMGYVSVIGDSWLHPIVKLVETLESFNPKGPNEVQASTFENGYSAAIVTLTVFLVESILNRTRYVMGVAPPSGGRQTALNFFRTQFPTSSLVDNLEELFVVRDMIAHNHLWEAQIEWGDEGLKFASEPMHPGRPLYGDPKFDKVFDKDTRKTCLLGINLFPTKICREDAITVLKCAYEILWFLETIDRNYCYLSIQPVEFSGQIMTFSDFVTQLN
jgi:hypothetical protein